MQQKWYIAKEGEEEISLDMQDEVKLWELEETEFERLDVRLKNEPLKVFYIRRIQDESKV